MNNISIAKESIEITRAGGYSLGHRQVILPKLDLSAVEVCSPEEGEELIRKLRPEGEMCRITVTAEDSFQAARRFENPFVMNFANAHKAGGGFLFGANAQEEALCRCSTLYASISSEAAKEMYHYNNTHLSSVESDYMLYSPSVCVFRDEKCQLLEEPFTASVMTVPAPNRHGAALFASEGTVREAMMRRIRIMLAKAAEHGHKNLILGAWGCGAFGNKPENVSWYFKKILTDEGYGRMFGDVCFAIYGSVNGKNYRAFCRTFNIE